MMSICCKEGLKIPPDVLSQLIVSANQDVRQTLNLLSLWAADTRLLDGDQLRKDAKNVKRDLKLVRLSLSILFPLYDFSSLSLSIPFRIEINLFNEHWCRVVAALK